MQVHSPVERLPVDDVDQDQADREAEQQSGRDADRRERRTLDREHRADLATRQADVAQHAELAAACERLRDQRGREADEPDHDGGDLQRIGDREGAVERRERQLPQSPGMAIWIRPVPPACAVIASRTAARLAPGASHNAASLTASSPVSAR